MKAKPETMDAKAKYKKRNQTVEPAFGMIRSAMGFTRFRVRCITKAAAEWTLIALAYNCRQIHRLKAA
jgi:Transposase DDE domain